MYLPKAIARLAREAAEVNRMAGTTVVRLREALALLARLEWSGAEDGARPSCPICYGEQPYVEQYVSPYGGQTVDLPPKGGHEQDCELARVLATLRQSPDTDK